MKQTDPPAAMREREELQSEAYSVLHHLWGEWREGTAYSQAIKDKWGRLLFLTQKLEDSRQAAQPFSEKIEAMRDALKAIASALHDDKGSYHLARAYLDKHGRYHGNLDGERVLLEVAELAILREELGCGE